MADSRIQDLPAIDALADGDLFPVAREGDSYNARKVTAGQMTDYIEGVAQPYLTGAQEAAANADAASKTAVEAVGKIGTAVEDTQAAQAAAEAARDEAVAAGDGLSEIRDQTVTAAEQAQAAVGQITGAAESAESAKQAAEAAKQVAEAAQEAAETARDTAVSSASQASQSAQGAAQSALDAQTAKEGAEAAQAAIENLGVDATTLESGSPATVQKTVENGVVKLTFGLPSGDKGEKGDTGASMGSIERVSGTGAPGTFDTYNVVLTDGTVVGQFQVYNGADGQGAGDMLKAVYDPTGKNTDVFAYIDQAVQNVPVPDVSEQIAEHNTDGTAHPDLRAELAKKETSGAAAAVQSNLDSHISDKQNPHATTAEQVGADPEGSAAQALTDAKTYTDQKISEIPTPDVSAQIAEHNASPNAHSTLFADVVKAAGGGTMTMGDTIGAGPYTIEMTEDGDGGEITAADVSYDNSESGMTATDVQAAISELMANKTTEQFVTEAIAAIPAGGGKRVARFTVGTSAAGWTASDCDYLCDGTNDQVEINAAIQALPASGGEVVILDGTYNITASITLDKAQSKLSGNGASTILKRMWNEAVGVINLTADYCTVEDLQIDGNKSEYSSGNGIYVTGSNNTITGNICNSNSNGIFLSSSTNNTVTGNVCNDNANYGIYLYSNSGNNILVGNTCNRNNLGIGLNNSSGNTIAGNTCNSNTNGLYPSGGSSNNTITGNTCNSNSANGICLYLSNCNNNTITGNTCNNNANYGIFSFNCSNNTITGNTCNNSSGICLSGSENSTVTGNTAVRGTGTSSDYTSSQYTIYLSGPYNKYNLIADNNIMGKNYTSGGGKGNTFVNNKYN